MATFSVSIPDELAEQLDRARGLVSRSRWLQEAAKAYLAKPVVVDEPAELVIGESVLEAPAPSKPSSGSSRLSGLYACSEDRCPYMSTSPGFCVHHRTRRLVKA